MLNNVVLVGRITKVPELKNAGSNEVVRFTLAVNRRFKSKDGERQADFISCVAWNATAKFISTYVKKGALLAIAGRIETGSYEDREGRRIYTTDVVCDNVQLIENVRDGLSNNEQYSNRQPKVEVKEQVVNKGATDFYQFDKDSYDLDDDDFDSFDIQGDNLPFE